MRELLFYCIQQPDEPIEQVQPRLKRSAVDAWRAHIGYECDDDHLLHEVRKTASLTGVRCVCYRLTPGGILSNHGL